MHTLYLFDARVRYVCGMSTSIESTLNDRQLRLWGIPVSVLALLIAQMQVYFPGRYDLFWKYALISILYTGLLWEVSRWLLIKIRIRFPGLTGTRKRILTTLVVFTLAIAIGQSIVIGLIILFDIKPPTWTSFGQTWIINFLSSLFFIVLVGGIYEAQYFFVHYVSTLHKSEGLKKQQVQQQLEALKNKVNPHFLFNALTTLSALIGEDRHRAERFVDELSRVYRYLLRAGRSNTTSLGEELQFLQSYIYLMKSRFESAGFEVAGLDAASFRRRDVLESTIPVLSLQNAVDFMVRTRHAPLQIQVDLSENALLISSRNKPKKLSFDQPENDWLHLQLNGATIQTNGDTVQIAIPISNKPVSE